MHPPAILQKFKYGHLLYQSYSLHLATTNTLLCLTLLRFIYHIISLNYLDHGDQVMLI